MMPRCGSWPLICTAVVSLLGAAEAAWGQFAEPPNRRIVARWLFDEGTGQAVRDATGLGSGGKAESAAWVEGQRGKALLFDGKGGHVVVPSSGRLNVGGERVTVMAWVRPESFQSDLNAIAQKWGDRSNRRQYQMTVWGQRGNVGRWYVSNDGRGFATCIGKTPIPARQWTHLAGTYDGSALRLYINGKLDATVAYHGDLHTSNIPFIIGGYGPPEYSGPRWFHGAIDDVVVANWALSPAEIQTIMNGEEPKQQTPDSPVVILSARRLKEMRETGLVVGKAAPYHAWAWQRAGVPVTWTLGDQEPATATAEGKGDIFAWVRLGSIDLPADQSVPLEFAPASARPRDAAVAALALARDAAFDPVRLWTLARVFPETPEAVADARAGQCRHLNLRFTMPAYKTKRAWETRAAWLREHVRVSSGLVPEPERTPLKPRVFGKIERDGYTIEKAFIESRPGFYCTGNLYRPRGKKGPFPAVASPHGHWSQGRFGHEPPRGSVPARCITLARLGYVVFAYDMVGYNDSAKQTGAHRGTFTSPHNELWGLSMMHLQSWNTIRVVDFLQGLPDVDPKRIGLTGCSGGGTQTFMVMGIEPRITAAAPACMVSGIMQGGCECENAPLLRIESNNIEISALMAPRPLIIPSATGDWTRETPKAEYPSIRRIYDLYGAPDRVANVHTKSAHGYNKAHREGVYAFFRRWIQGSDDAKKIAEPPFKPDKNEDLLVFGDRKLPRGAKNPETLKKHVIAECRRQRDELLPKKPADRQRFLDTLGAAYRHAILAEMPKPSGIAVRSLGSVELRDIALSRLVIGRKGAGDRVPAILYRPKTVRDKARACLVAHPEGKAGLLDLPRCQPGALLASLLASGHIVLAIDPYLAGEHHSPFARAQQKKVGSFFSTYNRTALVQRIQDILTGLAYLKRRPDVGEVALVGAGDAGAWCLLAAPLTPDGTRIVADIGRLAGDDDPRWLGDLFTPCILKAGGLPTAVALAAPRPLFLHNTAESFAPEPLRAAYRAASARRALRIQARPSTGSAISSWVRGD
jgi:dienelactone hydrolase